MADYGIKISKSGYDVKTCADKNLVFSSEWNSPRIKKIVSVTPSWEKSPISSYYNGEFTYKHNFGFVPDILTFAKSANGWIEGEAVGRSQGVSFAIYVYQYWINNSQIGGYLRGYQEIAPLVKICFLEKFYDV